jgi:uncharacterized membrane protein (DUF373 family)
LYDSFDLPAEGIPRLVKQLTLPGELLCMAIESEAIRDDGTEGTALERFFNRHMGNFIHLFLSVLAVLVMAAACISLIEIVRFDFPKLWATNNEYQTLHVILQSILLLAIAGELALLLLFHRTSAAVEVAMFVIARRMVATDATAFDLLLGSVAIAILLVVRFYFLPGKPK